jgi:hypothetical protein
LAHAVKHSAEGLEPDEVRQTLENILSSKYFVHAPKKKGFLRLICDFYLSGRAHELNEYILGYDVFERDNAYDPSADPVVRVTAHEIRKKLELYYQHEGADDPVRLEIPPGSYQPIFTRHELAATAPAGTDVLAHTSLPPAPATTTQSQPPAVWRHLPSGLLALGLAVLVLTIAVATLWRSNRALQQTAVAAKTAQDPATYGAVWAPFLESSSLPLVILSNPPVLRFANPSDPASLSKDAIVLPPEAVARLKDKVVTNPEVVINDSSGLTPGSASAPANSGVLKQMQTPSLVISTNAYTGMGEAIGLHYLTDLFRTADRSMLLKQSRTLSAEDLKGHNVILLGGVWVNEWSGKLSETGDFVFTNNGTIKNRQPQAGEDGEYIPQFDSRTGGLMIDYALITVKPNISEMNDVMMLAGVYSQGTEAAAEFVTNKNYLNQLNQRLQQLNQAGSAPRHYQALLKVSVENGIPTTISILALHELRDPQH